MSGPDDVTFPFLKVPGLQEKPRTRGLTSILDRGLGPAETADLARVAGRWIDVAKLGWGTSQLTPPDVLEEKLALYRSAGVRTCTGGTLLEVVNPLVEAFMAGAGVSRGWDPPPPRPPPPPRGRRPPKNFYTRQWDPPPAGR